MGIKKDMISIIVPVHNSAECLGDCVRSALEQTWNDKEILLVDDGSADGSGAMCARFARENDCVHAFRMEDHGVSAARNLALAHASGEFITFLDSDDRMAPGMLERLHGVLEETGADIAGCGFCRGTSLDGWRAAFEQHAAGTDKGGAAEVLTGTEFIRRGILAADTRIWSKLFRREAVGDTLLREGLTIGEDMMFLLDVIAPGMKIARVADPLYYYYINPAGAMEKPYRASYLDQIRCWDLAEEVIREKAPQVLEERESRAALARIRALSALLVAAKIAKLPDGKRRVEHAAFEDSRARLRQALAVDGCFAALPPDAKVKALLLGRMPRIYVNMYRRYKDHDTHR